MERIYRKNELNFALVWIGIYVFLQMLADTGSSILGFEKILTAPLNVLLVLYVFRWLKNRDLLEAYGLCPFRGDYKTYLYFLPLLVLASCNLWNGVTMNLSVMETALYILAMLCVGFLEEVIFRGFLFKAMAKDNVKQAVLISSLTFGIGHIVNLLNGAALLPTLLQICYAVAIGFLFTVIFLKSGSLVPCIITHSVLNALSVFGVEGSTTFRIFTAAMLTLVAIGYAVWILKKEEKTVILRSETTKNPPTISHSPP